MRLASFFHKGRHGYGLVSDETVRPVTREFADQHSNLRRALAAGALGEIGANVADPISLEDVSLRPAIPRPGKLIGIGMNYLAHTEELKRKQPEAPSLFVRFPDSVVGHGQSLVRPAASEQHDFEGELAVIIGRTARHVGVADALDHVAGYSCFLDGSIRDWQYRTSQFTAGKNFFHSGAFGPWLVTAEEIADPQALRLETRVSGEVMQQGNTRDMCFGIAELISFLSTIFPLEPGDVIATGTPSGVGAAREPQRWLRPGDVVEVEIEGIGALRNEVVAERG